VSDGVASTVDAGEIREVLRGAVDLYVHTSPELLPRRVDDIGLASQMKADGFRAAMMWNQFSHTGERATVASGVTGFDMRGSIILNGTVGGLNPRVTEHAIRMGACYVSMPTMSGGSYQNRVSDYARAASMLAGSVPVTDESGAVLPAVHDIIDVVNQYDVVLGLGYVSRADARAVLYAARDRGVRKIGVLRPFSPLGFTDEEVAEAMEIPGVVLQFPCSSVLAAAAPLAPTEGAATGAGPDAPAIAGAIRRYGAERCVVMSDTGWNDLMPLEWFTLGCSTLAQLGIGSRDLRTLVCDTPARLIGVE
jgi:hypothetical protein